MSLNVRALSRLPIPLGLLALAIGLRPYAGELEGDFSTILGYLPYLLALVTTVLGYQFNRIRFFILSLATALAYWLVQSRLQISLTDASAYEAFTGLSYAWPLMTLALLLFPERGIWNGYGALTLAAVLGLGLFSGGFAPNLGTWFPEQLHWFAVRPVDTFVLPWAASSLYVLALGAGLLILCWRDTDCEAALLVTLVASFLVLGQLHLDQVSVVMFTAAGLAQLFSILRSSHDMAYRDELTGLLGRRAFNEKLKGLGRRYSLAMLDVDHFKKFNDKHGHNVGDEVLRLVASRMSRVGAGGTAYRYGGEEFCIVFPRRDALDCVDALEEVRESIASYRMTLRDKGKRPARNREGTQRRGKMATRFSSSSVAVTVSVGLAQRNEEDYRPEDVIKAADQQLYKAKRAGRNRLKY